MDLDPWVWVLSGFTAYSHEEVKVYAATQWTPLPTGHGPLGLASLQKGQVTRRGSDDTNHYTKRPDVRNSPTPGL